VELSLVFLCSVVFEYTEVYAILVIRIKSDAVMRDYQFFVSFVSCQFYDIAFLYF